jgi:hypothetical protein
VSASEEGATERAGRERQRKYFTGSRSRRHSQSVLRRETAWELPVPPQLQSNALSDVTAM